MGLWILLLIRCSTFTFLFDVEHNYSHLHTTFPELCVHLFIMFPQFSPKCKSIYSSCSPFKRSSFLASSQCTDTRNLKRCCWFLSNGLLLACIVVVGFSATDRLPRSYQWALTCLYRRCWLLCNGPAASVIPFVKPGL